MHAWFLRCTHVRPISTRSIGPLASAHHPPSSSACAYSEGHLEHHPALGRATHTDKTAANCAPKKPRISDALGAPIHLKRRMPPPPASPQSLYRKLLSISSLSVSRAIDYYFDCPKALHSTKSFNLLIGLALQSASFSHVRRLFGAMRAETIPENMETRKLHVRWFIRIGKWDDACKRVLETTARQGAAAIPLPLWLELFGSQKRGALRHWVIASRKPSDPAEDVLNVPPTPRKRLVPRTFQRPHAAELSQYRALMQVSPLLGSSGHVQILPRTMFIVTQTMHRVGQRSLAFSTALAYLESLTPHLRRSDRRKVLDLVHLHLSKVARHKKTGLKQHFSQRRLLWQFLRARPDLMPSSTTLFLLLSPLRGCRRSGTLAMQCLRLFVKKWGPRVQSRLVRRRIASLALKEGRLDIVQAMLKLERRSRILDVPWSRKPSTSNRRTPWRTLFSQQGAENRRWRLIEDKFRRQLVSRSA